jgi:cysteinyl-tRNA synthetase
VDFSEDSLSEAKSGLNRFYITLRGLQEEMARPIVPRQDKLDVSLLGQCRQAIESFQTKVEEAMDDDFNTALAIGHFHDLQTSLNSLLNLSKGRPTEGIASILKQGFDQLSKLGWIFGLLREDPQRYLEVQKREGLKKLKVSEDEILRLIEERNQARRNKDWKRADEIRNTLVAEGILLEDAPSGTQWKLK